jgi:hypothetical protein
MANDPDLLRSRGEKECISDSIILPLIRARDGLAASQGHSRKISGGTPTRKSPRQHPQIGLAHHEDFPEDWGKMRGDEWKAFVHWIKTTHRQTICLSNHAYSAWSV